MSTGSLYRYNDNIYYLQLKDANPADLYETTFYLKLPASDSPLLASGDLYGSNDRRRDDHRCEQVILELYRQGQPQRQDQNRLKEGTKIHIVSNGDHNYTITGTLKVHPIKPVKTQL